MQRQQQGFTLIELVIVIVILGILSAFALPRFADLGGDARAASIEGVAGSMKSSMSITRSGCLASSDCSGDAADDSVDLDGEPITVAYGYPVADTDVSSDDARTGILLAAQVSVDDFDVTAGSDTRNTVTVAAQGVADGNTCEVVYEEAGSSASATVSTDTSGC